MIDKYFRNINYMRISVLDRCNLRCRYCMPNGLSESEKIPAKDILSFEQIAEIVSEGAKLGITRIKLTGGEPLLRKNIAELIQKIKAVQGIEQLTLTTNGILLKQNLPLLKAAGLDGVNVSIDTRRPDLFKKITSYDCLAQVEEGIFSALDAGLRVKTNTVLLTGINDKYWYELLDFAKNYKIDVRFIEMMPIGIGKNFSAVSNDFIFAQLKKLYPGLEEDSSVHGNGPARYVKIPGFTGGIGFISAIHGKFCESCNRIRLTASGKLKPCLCFSSTVDLKEALLIKDESSRKEMLNNLLKEAISSKPKSHVFENLSDVSEVHPMVQIGG